MTSSTNTHPSTFVRWPREIVAAVTLRAACAALVAPELPDDALDPRRAVVVTTACGALATRFALVAFIAARDTPAPRSVRSFDPFRDPTPLALTGTGPVPDRVRVRVAGDRCASAWRHWRAERPGGVDDAIGAAGALALAAWCSWALGSPARALVRAQHALDTRADDPLAALVARSVRTGNGPSWSPDPTGRTGSSTVG